MKNSILRLLVYVMALPPLCAVGAESPAQPPIIPVGLDAYLMWDRWPYQRIGARAYMRSTYDRRGGNETADASHFLYQVAEDFNVTLDVEGPGVLYFVRTNHWHGSPWHYEIDYTDHIVAETTTADPTKKLAHSVFIPEDLFPNPLTWTYSITKGADLMWVPIPFERRLRLAYSRTFYGTGYYIYHLYQKGANLSRPISSWNRTPPDPRVLELLRAAGTDIAPQAGTLQGDKLGISEYAGAVNLTAGGAAVIGSFRDGPAMIRALKLSAPRRKAVEFGRARLRITWDGRAEPSVDAPVALFFGAGTLYNRENAEYLVKALPVSIRFDDRRVQLACYFPMPYFRTARIELVGAAKPIDDVRFSVRKHAFTDPINHAGTLHATYVDHGEPRRGHDLVFLDTSRVEGGGDWSGSFVGTSFIFSDRAVLTTLEGDPRFFFDDSRTPQAYGTGTEEWGGGGDYWGGRNMTLPLAGHPTGIKPGATADDPEALIQSAYRFLLADLMPFGKRAVIRLEHGGVNQSTEHYRSVTFWYGVNSPSLVKTDEFNVGDPASEKAHDYVSPDATEPYTLTSRYEWGVDHIPGTSIEVYPAHTEVCRATKVSSGFTLKLRSDNLGVLLRRTLDYRFPNQRARVYVSDPSAKGPGATFVGYWYLAGSTTCYHSYPSKKAGGELGPSKPVVQTSNRRFRDDEFLLPRELTRGREAIRVRVDFVTTDIPLLPNRPVGEQAWSEIRYTAYCYVMPAIESR